jgi:hypothetical protein
MFISHKTNTIQQVHEVEWECRRKTKGLSKPEYWAWLATITSGDPPVADYSGETGYTIVECTDEDVQARLVQLDDYVSSKPEGITYNIKYYASKRDAEEILDNEGNSHDPKQYVQSHFVPDNTAKDARLLADEWERIRTERNRLLADCDWTQSADSPLSSSKKTEWGTYRTSLRNLPAEQSSKTTYADIEWPATP